MTRLRWRRLNRLIFRCAVLTGLFRVFLVEGAAAHDVAYELRGTGEVRLAFHYGDGSPMAGAKFEVFAPNETLLGASGATDSIGEMEFRAAQDGVWRVEVRDADGHTSRARVNLNEGWPDTAGHAVPGWFVTVSLVLNILLALQLFRGFRLRRRSR